MVSPRANKDQNPARQLILLSVSAASECRAVPGFPQAACKRRAKLLEA
jgi:hypothetical protein